MIRDEVEQQHRSGVNSLKFDPALNRLYSAGRDSIIRIWNTKNHTVCYVMRYVCNAECRYSMSHEPMIPCSGHGISGCLPLVDLDNNFRAAKLNKLNTTPRCPQQIIHVFRYC